jgi:hypothetical protein
MKKGPQATLAARLLAKASTQLELDTRRAISQEFKERQAEAQLVNPRRSFGGGGAKIQKRTLEARAMVAKLVDRLAGKVENWIREVHDGVPEMALDGSQMRTDGGRLVWIVPPSPKDAARLYTSLLEFKVPKLAKTEVTGASGEPLSVTFANVLPPRTVEGTAEVLEVEDSAPERAPGE